MIIPNIWESKKCSKPPTRDGPWILDPSCFFTVEDNCLKPCLARPHALKFDRRAVQPIPGIISSRHALTRGPPRKTAAVGMSENGVKYVKIMWENDVLNHDESMNLRRPYFQTNPSWFGVPFSIMICPMINLYKPRVKSNCKPTYPSFGRPFL